MFVLMALLTIIGFAGGFMLGKHTTESQKDKTSED